DGGGDDPVLGNRRVEHAGGTVFLLQAFGDAENAAEVTNVLAQHDDVLVASKHHVVRAVERLDHVHDGHRRFASSSSTIACCCSLRCQGISSNTSLNIVRTSCGKSMLAEVSVPFLSASRWAARTSADASSRSAACRSSSHSPSAARCAFSRSIGSPSGHALASLTGRYPDGSSEVEWP